MHRPALLCLLASLVSALLSFPALAEEPEARYGISPGDTLEISVWKDESLTRRLIVPPDGMIAFPLIGEVEGSGLSIPELRKTIRKKLSEYIPDVTVTVMLLEANSLRAYVIGKVNNPGTFPITMKTTVLQLLSMAGGLNAFAAEEDIQILRRRGEETVKIPFDYEEVRNGEHLEQNIRLERGDVVLVP